MAMSATALFISVNYYYWCWLTTGFSEQTEGFQESFIPLLFIGMMILNCIYWGIGLSLRNGGALSVGSVAVGGIVGLFWSIPLILLGILCSPLVFNFFGIWIPWCKDYVWAASYESPDVIVDVSHIKIYLSAGYLCGMWISALLGLRGVELKEGDSSSSTIDSCDCCGSGGCY